MYAFQPPFHKGAVVVCAHSHKCGCSTVARLCKTADNSVKDMGVGKPDLPAGAQLVYVHAEPGGVTLPDWVLEASFNGSVSVVDFNAVYLTEAEWRLRETDRALLDELEKLLDKDNPVRTLRENIRKNDANQ